MLQPNASLGQVPLGKHFECMLYLEQSLGLVQAIIVLSVGM